MLKKKLCLLIIIILISVNIPFINSATEEGYGEGNDNLGQFTDTFENDDNVSVAHQVINNVTLECMELNISLALDYENFTSYTEVDEDGDLTITELKIDISWMRRDAETYVWKDFSPNYFGDFEHLFKLNVTALEAGDDSSASISVFSLMTNSTPAVMDDLQASNWLGVMIHQFYAGHNKFGLRAWERDGGATVFITDIGIVYDVNDPVYVTFNRTGNNVGLYIFDSEARTNLIESHTGVGNGKTYRYFEPLANSGRDVDGGDWYSGYIEYMWLEGYIKGYFTDGYFMTEDYLNYTTGNSLALLTNSSIPEATTLTVQFSPDNSTWVDSEGNVGSTSIEEGFYSIDLRDLNYTDVFSMYNFSGVGILTPRLYQSRLITTNGSAINGVSAPSEDYAGLLIVGLILGLIIGIGASRS